MGSRGGRCRVLAALCVSLAGVSAPAVGEDFNTALATAKRAARTNFKEARARFAELREQAESQGRLLDRLLVDDQDCNLLQDFDGGEALQVARAGLAALKASATPSLDARLAGLRVAACEAETLADVGDAAEAEGMLTTVLTEASSHPSLAAARGVALRNLGNLRSRLGDLAAGQADLLSGCTLLRNLNLPDDIEVCDVRLASHFRRTGDLDEAHRIASALLLRAQQRGDRVDVGIYAHNVARIESDAGRMDDARRHYELALQSTTEGHDSVDRSYIHVGLAEVLRRTQQFEAALAHAKQAADAVRWGMDDTQRCRAYLAQAELLTDLHRPDEALGLLQEVGAQARVEAQPALRARWLAMRARALAQQARWQEAYATLQDKAGLDERLTQAKLSTQAARLRTQFNRDRDRAAIEVLQHDQRLKDSALTRQSLLLGGTSLALLALLGFALRKVLQGRRLTALATRDELTGLPNRRDVQSRLAGHLQESAEQGLALALLMIDIDHFKAVNDAHGHGVGDEVLRHVARVLAGAVRAEDWVGRLGGEEFVAVLPKADPDVAAAVAERMRRAVEARPCRSRVGELPVTVSVGVAAARPGDATPEDVLNRADELLYAAKHQGRNRVCTQAPSPTPDA